MAPFRIDRFLETCLRRGANEGWLVAGQPPLIRVEGHLRKLQIPPLSTDEVETTLRSLVGQDRYEYYQRVGSVDFHSKFGDVLEFLVTIISHNENCLGFFRIIRRSNIDNPVPPKAAHAKAEADEKSDDDGN